MRGSGLFAAAGLAAVLGAGRAWACPPPYVPNSPPAPADASPLEAAALKGALGGAYSEAQKIEAVGRALAHQREIWDQAGAVVLAEVLGVSSRPAPMGPLRSVRLRAVHWLKGPVNAAEFDLGDTSQNDCGPVPGFDAAGGKVGERFLVYFRAARPSPETVMDAIRPARIVEPKARALLDAYAPALRPPDRPGDARP